MKIPRLTGMQVVIANLRKKSVNHGIAVRRGLVRGGLFLQRESQKLVPVEFGFLKASAFTRAQGAGFFTVVNVGYTSSYALFVHEAVGMKLKGFSRVGAGHKGKYWDPQGRGQAKFLEQPAREKAREIGDVVRATAKGLS